MWLPHGRAFKVLDKEKFEKEVLRKLLNMTNYASFVRQCNLYCFRRLTFASGELSSGAYYYEYFLRGRPCLSRRIVRIKIKGTNHRPAASYETEPKLFFMPKCDSKYALNDLNIGWLGSQSIHHHARSFHGLVFFPLDDNADDTGIDMIAEESHTCQRAFQYGHSDKSRRDRDCDPSGFFEGNQSMVLENESDDGSDMERPATPANLSENDTLDDCNDISLFMIHGFGFD
mmetsp:Transcript_25838/g.40076  ORF Transcript_25838/g.40076 Transcript_25838/m.40076 type:complete len:230 (+) Transcript_25838:271-960(+)